MAWLNKAKMEPKKDETKEETKQREEEDVKQQIVPEAPETEARVPDELQPESAKFYEQQKPVVQKVMFLPLQPEMHELITLTKQMAQLELAIGNMVNTLVEGQKQMIANQEAEKKLLEALIKEIELASQSPQGM